MGSGLPDEPLVVSPLYGMILVLLFWGCMNVVYVKERVVCHSSLYYYQRFIDKDSNIRCIHPYFLQLCTNIPMFLLLWFNIPLEAVAVMQQSYTRYPIENFWVESSVRYSTYT